MKFIVKNLTKCAPRIGHISEISRLPDFQVETPAILLYTKGGSLPHITREVFKFITEEAQCIQVPVASTMSMSESLTGTELTLAEFVGMKESFVYVTVQDPGNITPSGHHLQNNVPVWTRAGKKYLNADSYMDVIETFKPDMYCVLSDVDTNKVSSKKRISKAVDQTISFMHKCLERHKAAKDLQQSTVIASVVGGHCLKSRERCIKDILEEKNNFGGYIINGLHNNGPELEFLPFAEVQPVVENDINLLPDDKLRIIEGCWNPVNIIKLVRMGIDLFDTSYLNLVTERSSALTFSFNLEDADKNVARCFEINFRDAKHTEDFSPILAGCTCLTCTKYTRAYLHHLVNVQELLGPILLTIHNTHHYMEFFKTIRQCVKNETIENLENFISKQFESHDSKKTKELCEKIEC